jgi:hypothetical protein
LVIEQINILTEIVLLVTMFVEIVTQARFRTLLLDYYHKRTYFTEWVLWPPLCTSNNVCTFVVCKDFQEIQANFAIAF